MKNTVYTILVVCLFLSMPGVAQNDSTTIDFKIKNFGVYVNGSFSQVTITSNFDTNNLEKSFITAMVPIHSINTNNTKRDKHLLASDYFDEPNYKQLKLTSTNIKKTATNTYEITANLTIKKTTKSIVIPARISEDDEEIVLNASFELNRRDYGVGGSSWVMSNTVKIQVKHIIKK